MTSNEDLGSQRQASYRRAVRALNMRIRREFPTVLPPPPIWEGDLSDDCCADWAGFLFHAEKMDHRCWWWAVVDVATGIEVASSNNRPAVECSGEGARQAAAEAARSYVEKHQPPPTHLRSDSAV